MANLRGDDILLCQITSQRSNDPLALSLNARDFIYGSLPVNSFIRPLRIFTANKNIILRKIGEITPALMDKVINVIIFVIKQ